MSKLQVCATGISVLLGVVSAFCWWRSAVVTVPHRLRNQPDGVFFGESPVLAGADLFKTLRLQAKWNRWAAIAATGAALAQVSSALLPS